MTAANLGHLAIGVQLLNSISVFAPGQSGSRFSRICHIINFYELLANKQSITKGL